MNNEVFLKLNKNLYESLQNFNIQENYLTLTYDKEYKIIITNVNLSNLDRSIFLLHPIEIFQIIYILELLYKNKINDNEKDFIKKYTDKYLKINDLSKNGEFIDTNRLWNLGLPINLAYDNYFISLPSSKLITEIIDKHNEKIESSHNKIPKLVLIKGDNPNFDIEEKEDNIKYFKDAGFTTIFLIITSIIGTCIYMAFFIVNN